MLGLSSRNPVPLRQGLFVIEGFILDTVNAYQVSQNLVFVKTLEAQLTLYEHL